MPQYFSGQAAADVGRLRAPDGDATPRKAGGIEPAIIAIIDGENGPLGRPQRASQQL